MSSETTVIQRVLRRVSILLNKLVLFARVQPMERHHLLLVLVPFVLATLISIRLSFHVQVISTAFQSNVLCVITNTTQRPTLLLVVTAIFNVILQSVITAVFVCVNLVIVNVLDLVLVSSLTQHGTANVSILNFECSQRSTVVTTAKRVLCIGVQNCRLLSGNMRVQSIVTPMQTPSTNSRLFAWTVLL